MRVFQGIQINCIAPGIIYNKTAVAAYGEHGEQLFMEAAKNIPKGRLGEVFEKDDHLSNDLIPQIIWNLTPGVQYTTGKNFSKTAFLR